jgi:hypothetical protein
MKLTIELDREADGRWIAEIEHPPIPGLQAGCDSANAVFDVVA